MPLQQTPQFKATPLQSMELPQPGIGGLNLKDLEFEQEVNQSPYMLNMMYRNGAFGKRYGQEIYSEHADEIYAIAYYGQEIFVHSGKKIYKDSEDGEHVDVSGAITFPEAKGLFIVYAQKLFYLCTGGFYEYGESAFAELEGYVPNVLINCKPDGTHSDPMEETNIFSNKFTIIYNTESTTTVYKIYGNEDDIIDFEVEPVIEYTDGTLPTYTIDAEAGTITFASALVDGNMNLNVTFTMKSTVYASEREQLLASKCYETFGGSNNSRLFLAGGGKSRYIWSDAYDISYWPESNFATLGNTEEDITAFGRQYNILVVFKPREIYSVISYIETQSTTIIDENIGLENFKTQLVNARIGCDAPYSIQLINNLLTWFNSKEGICTLVSTNIQDERNVRLISRNIDRTNSFDVRGILDLEDDPETIQSVDYDSKYFIVFPESGLCYMWDYAISPYGFSSRGGETPPKALDWFLFDNFYVKQFLKVDKQLLFASTNEDFNTDLIRLTNGFADLDFNGDGDPDAIHSYYMTPFMQFGAVEYLKNVKNIYVQCRGDTASVIDMWYYTEENVAPEIEPESIRIGGKLWAHFQWYNFQWLVVSWANTFRRKCNLKKIQMASFFFDNNEVNRDMSITHIGLQYQIVKNVR